MNILVTGAYGFLGKHISLRLEEGGHSVLKYGRDDVDLEFKIEKADAIFHLASVMRSDSQNDFESDNVGLTKNLVDLCKKFKKNIPIIFSSSIKAGTHTIYGISKKKSENFLVNYHNIYHNNLKIFRLKWLFGKWSKPFAHSVVSTFIAQVHSGEELSIHDPDTIIELIYIDDVVDTMVRVLEHLDQAIYIDIPNEVPISVGDLASKLLYFKECEIKGHIPNIKNQFEKRLFSTYISYKEEDRLNFNLNSRIDDRGSFTEILKSDSFGQISVNVTKVGIEKGNHYHNTKHEKFLVVYGEGVIKLRNIFTDKITFYNVSEKTFQLIDIPPGFIHSIKNTGNKDLVTVMWANEIFDKEKPDTFLKKV